MISQGLFVCCVRHICVTSSKYTALLPSVVTTVPGQSSTLEHVIVQGMLAPRYAIAPQLISQHK